MAKIGVFFAEGFEEIEALTVVDLCRRAGIEVVMVSVDDRETVTGSHGIRVGMDAKLSEADFENFSMLVLPGGMPGTKNLEQCMPLMERLDSFYKDGKWIAAVCAAPSIFGHRGYLEGKRAVAYPTFEDQLRGADVVRETTITDRNVITARGMGCAIDFALEIIKNLLDREQAEKIADSVIYQQ